MRLADFSPPFFVKKEQSVLSTRSVGYASWLQPAMFALTPKTQRPLKRHNVPLTQGTGEVFQNRTALLLIVLLPFYGQQEFGMLRSCKKRE
ncbi:hypothetical protein D4764_06G0012300 [Takifugu flavidus]|uniref:Uncharacterized protein n=1 Tax=Takifugu flavidus TaxID=433684 RepID=A0A5C6N223_9TELE|nr:hypothetical protein D4764_06G0012300 [Takifugu flavidus]